MKDLIIKHTAKVQANKLVMDNRELFQWDLANFEGKNIELVIKGQKNTRSNRMNRYYWGVLMKALTDFFNHEQTFNKKIDVETTHELMKMKFLGTKVWTMYNGEELVALESSKTLTNAEFIAYFENIIAWSAEFLNLILPKPNEEDLKLMNNETRKNVK